MTDTLWWVSVGGNDPEPARVVMESGEQRIYTIGCTDSFTPGSGVLLVEQITNIPLTPEKSAKAQATYMRKLARDRARGIVHSYRRF